MTSTINKWQAMYPHVPFQEDFARFIFDHHLHHAIVYYGHEMQVVEAEPALLVEGQPTKMSVIQRLFQGKIPVYRKSGVAAFDHQSITPIRHEEVQSGYTMIICNAVRNFAKPLFKEMHSYFELKCPSGEVYNFGLNSPEEIERGGVLYTFRTTKARYSCPDCNEFLPRVTLYKTPIDLSLEQGRMLLQKMKEMQQQDIAFSWLHNNCAHFVTTAAESVGIAIPIKRTIIGMFLPERVNQLVQRTLAKMPVLVQSVFATATKIIFIIPLLLLNIVRCLLGATKGVLAYNGLTDEKKTITVINSVYDFCFEPLTFNMPHALLYWQKQQTSTYIGAYKTR